jgi:RNA polymerase sigma factor (sigma-70 family)
MTIALTLTREQLLQPLEVQVAAALAQCVQDDRAALRLIFELEAPRMTGVALRILRRNDLAEEAVRDAFVRIWRSARSFDPARGPARTWVYAVVRNRALTILRDEQRFLSGDDPGMAEPEPAFAVAQLPDASALRRCLDELEPRRRMAVVLAYAHGLSHAELAGRLGVPIGTARSWTRRGLMAAAGAYETSAADNQLAAAEFVVGLLSRRERAAAERRIGKNRAFARDVEAWRARLADFDRSAVPAPPDPGLWLGIEQSLDAPAATPTLPRRRLSERLRAAWHDIKVWRLAAVTAAATALILVAIVTIALNVALANRRPVLIAVLINDSGGEAGAVINAFANGRAELIPLRNIEVPPGRALQIWTLWDRAVGARPVGLIGEARATKLDLDALPAALPDQLFEITLEPATGSPTGRPTGPVLFKGTAARAL